MDQAGDDPDPSWKVRHLEDFWRLVARNEAYICGDSSLPKPPIPQAEPDWEFEDAYELIRFYLKPLRRTRLFLPPPEVAGAGPVRAESAHQALMHLLNPPGPLVGRSRLLDAPEYLRIKREARAELDAVLVFAAVPGTASIVAPEQIGHGPSGATRAEQTPETRRPASGRSGRKKAGREPAVKVTTEFLEVFLVSHHTKNPGLGWLSQAEIAEKLKCSQSTVHRAMKAAFKNTGLDGYKSKFERR